MAYQNTTKFERFTPMLSQITLEGDKIVDVKKFFNNMNVVMMTAFSLMIFFPEYTSLVATFDSED